MDLAMPPRPDGPPASPSSAAATSASSWPPASPSSATTSSGSTSTPTSSSGCNAARSTSTSPACPRSSRRAWTAAACASPPATTRRSRAPSSSSSRSTRPQTMAGAADLRNIRRGDPLDRRQPQRDVADHHQQEHVADRDGRDDRGHPGSEAMAERQHRAAHRLQPGVPAPGQRRLGLLPSRPDRRRRSRSADDAEPVAGLYEGLPGEVIVTDLRTAEMIKYVANSFLATRVSFINEIARLCEQIGTDVDTVVAGRRPRPADRPPLLPARASATAAAACPRTWRRCATSARRSAWRRRSCRPSRRSTRSPADERRPSAARPARVRSRARRSASGA